MRRFQSCTAHLQNDVRGFCTVPSVAWRGLASLICFGNAPTSQVSTGIRLFHRMISKAEVTQHLSIKIILWKFTAPTSPWWGGCWEGLVHSVKVALWKILRGACWNWEEITTVLSEIEAVINSRTLTFIEPDVGEFCTLSRAELGRRLTIIPYETVKVTDNSRKADVICRHAYRKLLIETLEAVVKRLRAPATICSLCQYQINKSTQRRGPHARACRQCTIPTVEACESPRGLPKLWWSHTVFTRI